MSTSQAEKYFDDSDASDDDAQAPKGEATRAILAAIDRLRADVDTRLERVEQKVGSHDETLRTITNQVSDNTKQIAQQAEAITSVSKAAAIAAEISAQALARVNTAQDDARKMIESAMSIQTGAIAGAVRQAVEPIEEKARRQNEAIGAVIDELGLEDRVELGRKMKPGEAPPERALQQIDKRTKQARIVQLVLALGMIAEVVLRVWKRN